jgi:FkbM family methyltransferase
MLLKLPVPKRIAGRGIWTQRRFLNSEPPEAHIVDWVRRSLNAGDTFFDIGAHYGWISIAAASCVGRSGRVVAFEASPTLIDVLAYHKRLNRLHQMEIVPRAVTSVSDISVPFFLVNGGLSFRNSLTTGGDDVPYLAPNEKSRVAVRSISLDNFCLESGLVPNVIKIDVEGAELLVLQGAERILSDFSPVLIVGVHPYWLPKPQRPADILDLLRQHGYEIRDEHIVDFDGSYLADYLCATSAGITSGRAH